jgi:small subunit ribosomal protein S18
LTREEREILTMDPLERDKLLLKRLVQSWDNSAAANSNANNSDDDDDENKPLTEFARRVRLAKMALNVLGRTVQAQSAKSTLQDDGTEFGRDTTFTGGFTQSSLTQSEFDTFQRYMKEQHGKEITEEDIPVHPDDKAGKPQRTSKSTIYPLENEDDITIQGITDDAAVDADNPDLSLKWLTSRAQWEINKKYGDEGPFDEMVPGDLTMSRIVNRKRAKILPRELLHHNNLSLLRRYISPAGQIMHRVRTRLGARDQRKIAKMVKRARNLGLIPHTGQFVVEDHGSIYEQDIRENKPWEEELIRRGLVVTKKQQQQQEQSSRKEE